MWPDCSPPSDRPRLIISSITYLSPTGQRTISMPLSRSAISRPMLLITVATTPLPVQPARRLHVPARTSAAPRRRRRCGRPRRRRSRDRRRRRTPRRCGSRARPPRAPALSGCVEPQSRLMLRPSGDALNRCTSKPSSSNSRGATVVVAPFAVSTAMLEPAEPLRIRQRQPRMRDVGVDDVGALDRHVCGAADAPAPVGDDRFDLPLERLGELLAAPREHLDAVVLERIVRGGDDEPGVVAPSRG